MQAPAQGPLKNDQELPERVDRAWPRSTRHSVED